MIGIRLMHVAILMHIAITNKSLAIACATMSVALV